jgi:hypothetical protein
VRQHQAVVASAFVSQRRLRGQRSPACLCDYIDADLRDPAAIVIRAYYGAAAHHPRLQAGTAGDWPLNVFDEQQAAAQLPALRAIASADLHNLVFQRDYRIIPAIVHGWTP